MTSGPRLALLIALALPPLASGGEEENWQRLRAMPRERRVSLSEKLREFDTLTSEEKSAVREIDREVEGLSADNKAHYQSVLRRYHVWLRSLPEDRRKQIEATPPDRRLAQVSRALAAERQAAAQRPWQLYLQLAGPSPTEMARRLQPWFQLSPTERASIEKLPPPAQQKKFAELSRQRRVKPIARLTPDQEDALLKKLEADPQSELWLKRLLDKGEDQVKKGENAKGGQNTRQRLSDLADNYQFLLTPPKKVDPAHLLLFESSLPARFRAPFDYWPPDEARRRLTVLYRLIYPHPQEISSREASGDSKGARSPDRPPRPAARTPARAPAPPL